MTDRERLTFVVDVHVPHAIVHAISGNGFAVTTAPDATDDVTVLRRAAADMAVLLTNDRDFVTLHTDVDHAGIVIYSSPFRPPAEVLRGLRRINRQFSPETIQNTLLWLEEWL